MDLNALAALEKYQQRDEELISLLKKKGGSVSEEKIKKLQSDMQKRLEQMEKVKTAPAPTVEKKVLSKPEKKVLAKPAKPEKKVEKKTPDYKYTDNNTNGNMRDYSYMYKQYRKAVETLPEYIKKNLGEMTCNKGYIWRGCWFFGRLPASKQYYPMVMFEKVRGGILRIHEHTPTDYFVYEKKGQDRKTLVSQTRRLKRTLSYSVVN